MTIARTLAAAVALSLASSALEAHADDKAACFAAAAKGQSLRNEHKFVAAREQFRVCARLACPAVVSKDCGGWLDGVEQSLPTVVISAKDGAGKDLIDVKVSIDGQPFATKLIGDALPMDPGPHALHAVGPDGTVREQQIVVREGAKNESVALVIGTPPPPPPVPVVAPAPASAEPAAPLPSPEESSSTWRTVGWVVGAVGVVGLGVGTAFGVKAIADKNSAHCDASGACDPGPLSNLDSSSTLSTVGFVAGGVLLAAGASLVLFAPSGRATTSSLRLTPTVGASTGGMQVGGTW